MSRWVTFSFFYFFSIQLVLFGAGESQLNQCESTNYYDNSDGYFRRTSQLAEQGRFLATKIEQRVANQWILRHRKEVTLSRPYRCP